MKKIIPFTKDIKFNTKLYEITSISLENNLIIKDNNLITGEFILSGDYKMNDSSINSEPYIYNLPFDITLDTKYDTDKLNIDIDDFKYEIINEEILRVNIDVLLEGVEMVSMIDEIKPDVIIDTRKKINDKEDENNMNEDLFLVTEENIKKVDKEDSFKNMDSIFNNFSDKDEKFVSYYVYIMRENDTLESVIAKYNISIDELKEYNDLDQITLGSKLIIPSNEEV